MLLAVPAPGEIWNPFVSAGYSLQHPAAIKEQLEVVTGSAPLLLLFMQGQVL